MARRTFNSVTNKNPPRAERAGGSIDIAARYFVYKLYEATGGQRMEWRALTGMGETPATVARAVECGWVIVQAVLGSPRERRAALTFEGRQLARKGRS